jgi:hypothetical protein
MKYFVIILFALSLEASAANHEAERTIIWQPWQESDEYRVRMGTDISEVSGGNIT